MYSLQFRVNLLHDPNSFQNSSEIAAVTATKTIYLPVGRVGSLPIRKFKHGDVFTLYDKEAVYLKRLITNGLLRNVEFHEESEPEVVFSTTLMALTDDDNYP